MAEEKTRGSLAPRLGQEKAEVKYVKLRNEATMSMKTKHPAPDGLLAHCGLPC